MSLFSAGGKFLTWNRKLRYLVLGIALLKITAYVIISVLNPRKTFRGLIFICKFLTLIICQQTVLKNEPVINDVLKELRRELSDEEKVSDVFSRQVTVHIDNTT